MRKFLRTFLWLQKCDENQIFLKKNAFSIDIRYLNVYLYLCKNEKVKAFGCIWVSKFENKRKALILSRLLYIFLVWLCGFVKRPARGHTCHEILLQGAVMAYS